MFRTSRSTRAQPPGSETPRAGDGPAPRRYAFQINAPATRPQRSAQDWRRAVTAWLEANRPKDQWMKAAIDDQGPAIAETIAADLSATSPRGQSGYLLINRTHAFPTGVQRKYGTTDDRLTVAALDAEGQASLPVRAGGKAQDALTTVDVHTGRARPSGGGLGGRGAYDEVLFIVPVAALIEHLPAATPAAGDDSDCFNRHG